MDIVKLKFAYKGLIYDFSTNDKGPINLEGIVEMLEEQRLKTGHSQQIFQPAPILTPVAE